MEIILRKPDEDANTMQEETNIFDKQAMEEEETIKDFNFETVKKNLKLRSSFKKLPRKTLNRRYKKLQLLIEEGDYFSEQSIKIRSPLLYQLYIGRYITNNGENELTGTLSNFLTNQSLRSAHNMKIEDYLLRYPYMSEHLENVDFHLRGAELEDAEDELIVLMHHSFLAGLDHLHVDYNKIDNDESLDDFKVIADDEEEVYFMGEDDYSNGHYKKPESDYTGELDY